MTNPNHQRIWQISLTIMVIAAAIVAVNLPTLLKEYSGALDVSQTGTQKLQIKLPNGQAYLFAKDIVQIRQGENSLVVLDSKGQVFTQGRNDNGQLGLGTFGGDHTQLTKVTLPASEAVKKIDMVQNHVLAMTSSGTVYAWGLNISGEIGNGSNQDVDHPVKVFSGATDIAAGYRFSAALDKSGQLWAWGMHCDQSISAISQLAAQFAQNASLGGSYYNGVEQANNYDDCLNEDRLPIASLAPHSFPGAAHYTSVSAGYGHILLTDTDGGAWSFGCNTWGQLGRLSDDKQDYRAPAKIAIADGRKVVQLSAGFRHSAAIDDLGRLWIWGNDIAGSRINNDANTKLIQVKLPAGVKPAALAASYDLTAFTDTAGNAYAIGNNTNNRITSQSKTAYVANPVSLASLAAALSPGRSNVLYWNNGSHL